ncbi:MAG: transposase [Erysipelotrichaceae bacterium]|nr:transposase [Erysipelotrichaceae bacterium]
MYRPFQKAIGTTMPNAQWAVDHFHVTMKANEAVDSVRKELQKI